MKGGIGIFSLPFHKFSFKKKKFKYRNRQIQNVQGWEKQCKQATYQKFQGQHYLTEGLYREAL